MTAASILHLALNLADYAIGVMVAAVLANMYFMSSGRRRYAYYARCALFGSMVALAGLYGGVAVLAPSPRTLLYALAACLFAGLSWWQMRRARV